MAIYNAITEWSATEYCMCSEERMAICPECGHPVCVFCEDCCEGCWESVF